MPPVDAKEKEINEAFGFYANYHMDVQVGHLWDSFNLKSGEEITRPVELFVTPVGAMDIYMNYRKTEIQTNMTQSKRLDAPEAFSVQSVLFTFSRASIDHDVYDFTESVVWYLRYRPVMPWVWRPRFQIRPRGRTDTRETGR